MEFEKRIERIVTPGIELQFFLVPWDTAIFGFPVAQIECITVHADRDPTDGMRQLGAWFDRNDIRLASCRLASNQLRESMLLEAHGFRFVEMVFRPTLAPIPSICVADADLLVSIAPMERLAEVEAIAGCAFTTGRFLIDWRLDSEASHRRYRAWARNSLDDPRQTVLQATLADELVGFFIVEVRADRSAYWHLTAIAPAWQHKGIGRRLWSTILARHRGEGVECIQTTISAHNTAVMNIYASLGFRFQSPQMTFQWVRGPTP